MLAPAARCSSRRWWMYSVAPMSTPRVGWAAMTTAGQLAVAHRDRADVAENVALRQLGPNDAFDVTALVGGHSRPGGPLVFLTTVRCGTTWFPLGPDIAALKGADTLRPGTTHYFYDHTANTSIVMADELILEVMPRANASGFVLAQFTYDIDSAPEHFEPAIK